MENIRRKPLNADPSRQAVDTLRGYAYQIWRSVDRWVSLPPGYVLYLEGAEDVDLLGPGVSEAEQIKALSGTVTLASADILESVLNYWSHQQRNQALVIDFRFLTTAKRGKERSKELGAERGLDLWDRCREADCKPDALRAFLAARVLTSIKPVPQKKETQVRREAREKQNAIAEDLHRFLTQSSDDELRERLLRRITWDTGSSPQPEIEARVLQVLREYGARTHSAPPSESDKVLAHLLKHAWDVACREQDRWVSYADFLKIFESVVAVSVTRVEYQRLRQLEASVQGGDAIAGEPPATAAWYKDVLRGTNRAARDAFAAGELDDAETTWTRLLDEVRRTAPVGPERRDFEQTLLLSLAQVALRRNQHRRAEGYLREAEGITAFGGRNRYMAGWLLINLGRNAEAVAQLDPHDGTPEWRSALGIALLATNDETRFRVVCGDEKDVEEPDLLLALVRYHVGRGESVQADHAARRAVRCDEATPESRFRAIEAGFLVFNHFAWSDKRPPLNGAYWIAELRRLFADSDTVLTLGAPVFRHLVLRRRLEFHRALLETEPALRDFHSLVTSDPADAAHIAAVGISGAASDDLALAAEAAKDPVERALIDAERLATSGELAAAAVRLETVETLADNSLRSLVLAMRLELRAASAPEQPLSLEPLDSIEDPVSRAVAKGAVLKQQGDWNGALAMVNFALNQYPDSLRLLRVARLYTHLARADDEFTGSPDAVLASREVALAEALVRRLPCPEHLILLAWAKAAAGDLEAALTQVREVEAAGYRTHGTTRLLARLTLALRRFSEHAEAAWALHEDFDSSSRAALTAAEASVFARDYGRAESLLKRLIESDDREVATRAYIVLAFATEAQGRGVAAAREEAVRILLAGYDRLGGPVELAGHMLLRSLETRYAREVGERIIRDHGSFASLPGVVSLPAEEGLEMIRQEQEGNELRTKMFAAGAIPFETYASLGPRRSAYLWFAYRENRVLLLVDPPSFSLPRQGMPTDESGSSFLLDRTALLTLAEIELIDEVLQSPLHLWLGQETFDWLTREQAQLVTDYRPGEHERLRRVITAVEGEANLAWTLDTAVAEEQVKDFQEKLNWGDAYELALACRDNLLWVDDFVELEKVPPAHRDRVIRSADLLLALVTAGRVSFGQADEAEREHPSTFKNSDGRRLAPLDQRLLLSWGPLEAWEGSNLLTTLARTVPQLVVSPLAERQVRQALAEQEAYSAALRALTLLVERIVPAVEAGRVRLLEASQDVVIDEPEDDALDPLDSVVPEDNEGERERLVRSLLAPLDRLYAQARSVGATVWSDDAATHLYRDLLGPLLPNNPDVQEWAAALRERHPNIAVVGTRDVLRWMEGRFIITAERRRLALTDLVGHGRALLIDSDLLVADVHSNADEPGPVLRLLSSLPAIVPTGSGARFVGPVMLEVAPAIARLWTEKNEFEDEALRTDAVIRILDALQPWFAADQPFSRFSADTFWFTLTRTLRHHLQSDPAGLIRAVMKHSTERADLEALLGGVWPALESLDAKFVSLPIPARLLYARVFSAVAEGAQSFEVRGRPVLPFEVLRIASQRFGIDFEWRGTLELQTRAGLVQYGYALKDAERRAAADLEATIAAAGQELAKGVPAQTFATTLEVESLDGAIESASVEVDLLYLLDQVNPTARSVVIASLALYYREVGAPELAELMESHAEVLGTEDPQSLDAALDSLFGGILGSPRFWANHDPYQAFTLLRDARFEYLLTMAGSPERWLPGESLLERVTRLCPTSTSLEEWLGAGAGRWGPFLASVLQWRAFLQMRNISDVTDEEGEWLLLQIVHGETPYTQITAYGFLLGLLHRFPTFREKRVGSLTPDVAKRPNSPDLVFDGTYLEFSSSMLAAWLQAELEPPVLSEDPGPWFQRAETDPLGVIADMHHHWARLHALVTRLVYRAVLTDQHFHEAAERMVDGSAADPVAELLHVGHRLVDAMYIPLLDQARSRGITAVIREVERISVQHPLSEPRIVADERFTPEVIGVGPDWVNPYLSYLFAMLEVDHSLAIQTAAISATNPVDPPSQVTTESGHGNDVLTGWRSAEVMERLRTLAARPSPSVLAYVENVSEHPNVQDRFQSLLTEGIEVRAQRLLVFCE
ncbi:MAG TPA: hypothetical protein VF006_18140 [Longimicrobium sp.]